MKAKRASAAFAVVMACMRAKWMGVAMATLVSVCALAGTARHAKAATILQSYLIEAANVRGAFTAVFDPTLDEQGPIPLNGILLSLPGNFIFGSIVTSGSTAVIGNNCSTSGCVVDDVEQFSLSFNFDARGLVTSLGLLTFDTAALGRQVETAAVIPFVPLPASAPLFGAALAALGGMGYAGRLRRGKPA